MAKSKKHNKTKRNISLGEYKVLSGITETVIAGFKVWLGGTKTRTEEQWNKELNKFLKS